MVEQQTVTKALLDAWLKRWPEPSGRLLLGCFDLQIGPLGKHLIHDGGVTIAIEVRPGDDIVREMRLQTECMCPGCEALADQSLTAFRVHEANPSASGEYTCFRLCADHGVSADAWQGLALPEGELHREAIRRGILPEPIKRGDFVSHAGRIVGVAMESVNAGEMLTLHTTPAGAIPPTGEVTYPRYAGLDGIRFTNVDTGPPTVNGQRIADSVKLSKATGEELDRLAEHHGYFRAPEFGVLAYLNGAIRTLSPRETVELPAGAEFIPYDRAVLDVVSVWLATGGVNESRELYEEAKRRVQRDWARMCAESERMEGAARDARGALTEKLRREDQGKVPAIDARTPGATPNWKSFDSGCNWED